MIPNATLWTLQDGAQATGAGTPAVVADAATLVIQTHGTWSATLAFEASVDGSTWQGVQVINLETGQIMRTTADKSIFCANVAGMRLFRARITSYSSGAVYATAMATTAPNTYGHTACQYLYTGSDWQMWRTNSRTNLLSSMARTASVDSAEQQNHNYRGLVATLHVSALSGTPSITLKVQFEDSASGEWVTLLEGAAVTATGTYNYVVYPGAGTTALHRRRALPAAQPLAHPRRARQRRQHHL